MTDTAKHVTNITALCDVIVGLCDLIKVLKIENSRLRAELYGQDPETDPDDAAFVLGLSEREHVVPNDPDHDELRFVVAEPSDIEYANNREMQ